MGNVLASKTDTVPLVSPQNPGHTHLGTPPRCLYSLEVGVDFRLFPASTRRIAYPGFMCHFCMLQYVCLSVSVCLVCVSVVRVCDNPQARKPKLERCGVVDLAALTDLTPRKGIRRRTSCRKRHNTVRWLHHPPVSMGCIGYSIAALLVTPVSPSITICSKRPLRSSAPLPPSSAPRSTVSICQIIKQTCFDR